MANIMEKVMQVVMILVAMLNSEQVSVQGGLVGQYFVTTPQNMTVNSGTKVSLQCVVGNLVGNCQWTRDGFGLGLDRQLPSFPRYLMPEKIGREGVCDLIIDPVLPLDEGVYQCQVSGGSGLHAILSPPARLSVSSEPGLPHIVQAREVDQVEMEQGELVELQCESHGGRPSAELNWIDGEGNRIISDVTQHVTKIENTNMFKTVSMLSFTLQKPEKISCTAHSEAFPVPRLSRSLEINFGQKPMEEVKKVREGESFELTCSDHANPVSDRYQWLFNDIEQTTETKNVLVVENFTKDYDGSVLKCMVDGLNGKTRLMKVIRLHHDASAVSPPLILPRIGRKNEVEEGRPRVPGRGQKTVFTCVAEDVDTGEPDYVWVNGSIQSKEQGTFEASDDNNKKFVCKSIPSGHRKMREMGVKMKGMSKTFRKFSKFLNRMTTSIDMT